MTSIRNHSCGLSRQLFILILLHLWIFALPGCASKGDVRTTTPKREISINKIAVLPFQIVTPEDQSSNTVRCPLSGHLARSCSTPGDVADVVEDLFLERLKANSKLVIIPGDKTEGVYRRIQAESFKASPVNVIRQVGKELGVDGIAVGYIYCYRERKGYSYSVEKPASVSFEVSLVRVSDGTILWDSYFDKTQESLMENLLQISTFIKGGGKWVTARQLSADGMDRMMETFPGFH